MNRKQFSGIILGLLCLSGISQDRVDTSYFYYYHGEKQFISINTQCALVGMPVAELSKMYAKSGGTDRVRESNHKDYSEIEFGESLSSDAYLEQLAALEKKTECACKRIF